MQDIAGTCGLRVVLPSFFGEEVSEIETALEKFYLVIMRKTTEEQEESEQQALRDEEEKPPEPLAMPDITVRLE